MCIRITHVFRFNRKPKIINKYPTNPNIAAFTVKSTMDVYTKHNQADTINKISRTDSEEFNAIISKL